MSPFVGVFILGIPMWVLWTLLWWPCFPQCSSIKSCWWISPF